MSEIIVERQEISSDPQGALDNVFTAEVRVYMLNMYPQHARRVYCEVSVCACAWVQ